jgi:hypothetical protein
MQDVILIITEGSKPEHNRLNEINTIFLNNNRNIVLSPDVGNIKNLIKILKMIRTLTIYHGLKSVEKLIAP